MLVCVTRRKDRDRWGIPKGMIDRGDTAEQTALNEAWEEAGLRGRLTEILGSYRYEKWARSFVVTVYVMEVLDVAPTWDEERIRDRAWVSFAEAAELLADHPALPLLQRAIATLLLKRSD